MSIHSRRLVDTDCDFFGLDMGLARAFVDTLDDSTQTVESLPSLHISISIFENG